MIGEKALYEMLTADSFLEYAFLRWVVTPAVRCEMASFILPQHQAHAAEHNYRIDYAFLGSHQRIAVELDGFSFHGSYRAFTYDRLRQNDLMAEGWIMARFSYSSIRAETSRCVAQLQALLSLDPTLRQYIVKSPLIEQPTMDSDPIAGLCPAPRNAEGPMALLVPQTYFASIIGKLNVKTLRDCQAQAFAALARYYGEGRQTAACVMSVGAGKTALGVTAVLAFPCQRALIVTPGSVIRGTFATALDPHNPRGVLYSLPGGPLIPGCPPPSVLVLDREEGAIRRVTRDQLLRADVIVTNFHSLGTGQEDGDLLGKLQREDIDFVVIDEAHIAAADSYQRVFAHFSNARCLLMSACFQRLDGKPIAADVVYRYRLIDSIADGNAKNLRVHRFVSQGEETTYEIVQPDGRREEIIGRDALLAIVQDEKKLARIVARSDASIRQVVRAAKEALDHQAKVLHPVKPRVLFSAMGERHAEQIARIAEEYGIPCAYVHHSMTDAKIKGIRDRFEQPEGDLQGIVQLKMFGQGYDFPPITVVVPMRPYGSFSEFYQFIGRGIRMLLHPALEGRVGPGEQFLDIIYHSELGLDTHIDTVYRENDMDPPSSVTTVSEASLEEKSALDHVLAGTTGSMTVERPEAFVLVDRGSMEQRIIHNEVRVEQAKMERERYALAQRYATYAQGTDAPVTLEQFIAIVKAATQ